MSDDDFIFDDKDRGTLERRFDFHISISIVKIARPCKKFESPGEIFLYLRVMPRLISHIGFFLLLWGMPGFSAPLTLEEVILRALASSDEIEIAESVEKLLRLEKRMGLLAFFPRFSGGFTATDTVIYHSPDTRGYRISLGVDQPIYTGGSLVEEFRNGKAALEIHRYERKGVENAVVFEAVAGYTRLIVLETRIEIQIMTEDLLSRQLEAAEEELALGLITELTFAKMHLARERQVLARRAVEIEYRVLRERLAEKLEIVPPEALEPTEGICSPYTGTRSGGAAALFLSTAREHNPDLVARRLATAAAERGLKHAKRFWIPRISLRGEVSVTGDRFPLSTPGFSVGVDISVPLPFIPLSGSVAVGSLGPDSRFADIRGSASENPSRGGKILAARTAMERAEADFLTALVELEDGIASSFLEIERAGDLIEQEKEYLTILEAEERIAAEELRTGGIGRLEFSEAAVERASQRGKILEAQYAQFLRELELYALGGFSLIDIPVYHRFLETGE
jgi:outer membrane protein TolC